MDNTLHQLALLVITGFHSSQPVPEVEHIGPRHGQLWYHRKKVTSCLLFGVRGVCRKVNHGVNPEDRTNQAKEIMSMRGSSGWGARGRIRSQCPDLNLRDLDGIRLETGWPGSKPDLHNVSQRLWPRWAAKLVAAMDVEASTGGHPETDTQSLTQAFPKQKKPKKLAIAVKWAGKEKLKGSKTTHPRVGFLAHQVHSVHSVFLPFFPASFSRKQKHRQWIDPRGVLRFGDPDPGGPAGSEDRRAGSGERGLA